MIITVLNSRQSICTVPLTSRDSISDRPATGAVIDRLAVRVPIVTDVTDALFTLADDMADLYPADSFLN
jgi:hypothetical protein